MSFSHTSLMAAFVYPLPCPWMVACQTKFQMGSGLFFTLFLILMYISTIGRGFKPSQTRLFTAFRQLFLIVWFCLSTAPLTRARSCSVFSCQFPRTDPLLYCIIDKVSAIIRTDFSWNSHLGTISVNRPLPLPPNLVSRLGRPQPIWPHVNHHRQCVVSHKGLIRWNPLIRYSNGPAGAGLRCQGVLSL